MRLEPQHWGKFGRNDEKPVATSRQRAEGWARIGYADGMTRASNHRESRMEHGQEAAAYGLWWLVVVNRARFGPAWDAYATRTPAFVPALWGRRRTAGGERHAHA